MTYSQIVVAVLVAVLVVDLAVLRTRMVTRRVFWVAYAIVIVFQLLMNGVLTGLDVVTYDPGAMVTLTLASWAAVNRRANTARRRGFETDTRPSSTR